MWEESLSPSIASGLFRVLLCCTTQARLLDILMASGSREPLRGFRQQDHGQIHIFGSCSGCRVGQVCRGDGGETGVRTEPVGGLLSGRMKERIRIALN